MGPLFGYGFGWDFAYKHTWPGQSNQKHSRKYAKAKEQRAKAKRLKRTRR